MSLTVQQVLEKKDEIIQKNISLTEMKSADDTFILIKRSDKYYVELGNEVIDPSSLLNDNEILEWAMKNELYEKGDDPNIKQLRVFYDESKMEFLPSWTYPSGRAYDFFGKLEIDPKIWEILNIALVDGEMPGSDFCYVFIEDYNSVVLLQWVLKKLGIKVNFIESQEIND